VQTVIPAPAFAGVNYRRNPLTFPVIPAEAGIHFEMVNLNYLWTEAQSTIL